MSNNTTLAPITEKGGYLLDIFFVLATYLIPSSSLPNSLLPPLHCSSKPQC